MPEHYEIAIIGAGPGGIGAATNAAHHKMSHILFEKGQIANTIYDYQLRKHVMAEPRRLPLRARCRFDEGSREDILQVFAQDLETHATNLVKAEVTKIVRIVDRFEIHHSGGTCTARYVVLASGVQGSPRKLGAPGEDLPHISYTLADPGAFKDKKIIVVGAGDAAIENALALMESNSVFLINRGGEFARAKEANVKLVQNAIQSGRLKCYFDSSIARIEPDITYLNTPQGEVTVASDHIIVRAGCVLPRKFIESMGVTFPNADPSAVPVVTERYESNVPGLYIIGALIGYPLIKQAINQGYEVIEHVRGNAIQPADQPLLEERFSHLPGGFASNFPKVYENLTIFQGLSSSQLREMLIDSKLHRMQPGDVVFERNDFTDTFWSIVSGFVEVEVDAEKKIPLGQGNFFGEMGLISGRRRLATVRAAAADTLLLEIPRKQMLKLTASVDSVRRALDEAFALRVLQTSIFPKADPSFLMAVTKRVKMKGFKKGEVLFSEGDVGDKLYVIRKGSVKISRRNSRGANITQTYIPAGRYVGEMSLLSEQPLPRSATVTAAVACETIVIEKDDLWTIFRHFPAEQARVERLAEERKIENATLDQREGSSVLLDFMFGEGLSDADNVLLIDSSRCIACDNCEAACAATHDGYSRLDRKGGKSLANIQIPISCRHCENPLCMTDCPPDALSRMPNGEVIIRDSCIGCGNCVGNCPYGVISVVHEKPGFLQSLLHRFGLSEAEEGPAKAAKCDQCHELKGGPACVRACPTGAAMRVNSARLIEIAKSKGM